MKRAELAKRSHFRRKYVILGCLSRSQKSFFTFILFRKNFNLEMFAVVLVLKTFDLDAVSARDEL